MTSENSVGKTRIEISEIIESNSLLCCNCLSECILAFRGGHVYWCSPTHDMNVVGWHSLKELANEVNNITYASKSQRMLTVKESDRRIEFAGGGYVQARTANEPDRLRGVGLDLVVLDEAAFIDELAWTEALRPALADKNGKAIFISTPKGRNWFHRLHEFAKKDTTGQYQAWQLPTSVNPLIKEEELQALREQLPESKFRQEHLAEFLDSNYSVFRNVRACVTAEIQKEPLPDHEYLFSVDWGKQHDFTVICVFDLTLKACVYLERFNQIDYTLQMKRLHNLYDTFLPSEIVAEQNSIGTPIIEQLQLEGLPVKPFLTIHSSKKRIIEGLALAFEREAISIPNHEVLISELEAFEVAQTRTGLTTYSAPSSFHDDTVIALAIGWDAIVKPLPQLSSFSRSLLGI